MRKRIKRREFRSYHEDNGVVASTLKPTKRTKTEVISRKIAEAFKELNQ